MKDKSINKGRKLTFWAIALLVSAFICAFIALTLGAANRENWLEAGKNLRIAQGYHGTPVFKTATFSPDGVNRLKLNANGGDYALSSYDGEEILVEYYEDYENESVCGLSDGALTVKRDINLGSMIFYNSAKKTFVISTGIDRLYNRDYYDVKISLPYSLAFESASISVNGGNATVRGVGLGSLETSVNGGTLDITDCVAASVGKIEVNGGKAVVNGLNLGATAITVNGGRLTAEDCDAEVISKLNINGGVIELSGCRVTLMEKIIVRGGRTALNGCEISAIKYVEVSGGQVYLSGAELSGETELKISGGLVQIDKLGVPADSVSFNINSSGGRVAFNGERIGDGYHGTHTPVCLFKVKVSGGRLTVNTITK